MLERRRLLAASLANGTLTVQGTPQGDVINVGADASHVTVTMNDVPQTFDAADVQRIGILAGDGADTVVFSVDPNIFAIPSTVLGGGGNDFVERPMSLTSDSVDGGEGNDFLIGAGTLRGGAGNDQLYGTGLLDGGAGPFDLAQIGPGNTLVNDEWFYDLPTWHPAVTINGTDGNDTVEARDDGRLTINDYAFNVDAFTTWTINLKGGDDQLTTLDVQEGTFDGGSGDDTFWFADGRPDSVQGGSGNDTWIIDESADDLGSAWDGGAGTDLIDDHGFRGNIDLNTMQNIEDVSVGFFPEVITGNALNNRITAPAGRSVTIVGNGGNDTLTGDGRLEGGSGNDSLQGLSGNDTLDGGSGADVIKGGGGNDTADYSARTANLTIGIGTLADDGQAGEHDNVYLDIETIFAGSGNDSITGGAANNLIVGNGGNDTLRGNFGNDTLVGMDGNDKLLGEGNNDQLVGNLGNDSLDGGAGADSLDGGGGTNSLVNGEATQNIPLILDWPDGNVTVLGTNAADTMDESTFNFIDLIVTVNGVQRVYDFNPAPVVSFYGYGGNDTIVAGGGISAGFPIRIDGGDGDDTFMLNEGVSDTVFGGNGNDLFKFNGAHALSSHHDGGPGTDTADEIDSLGVSGTTLDLNVAVSIENGIIGPHLSTIIGTAGPNRLEAANGTLIGNGGNDTLVGGSEADSLDGGQGNDLLDGGAGNDTLNGGDGTDTAVAPEPGDTLISIEVQPTAAAFLDAQGRFIATGTGGPDQFYVSFGIDSSGEDAVGVLVNGKSYAFAADLVNEVIVSGLGGDDSFTAGESHQLITFNGGDGNDHFRIQDDSARINAGSGNDVIELGGGYELGAAKNAFTDGGGIDVLYLNGDFIPADNPGQFDMNLFPGLENLGGNVSGVIIGNDSSNYIHGGSLAVTIRGMGGNDTLLGGTEADSLDGGAGNDSLDGGAGNDSLDGGGGADLMKGGGGNDTADYSSRIAKLTIGIGTLADDGEANEHDNVYLDVEKVIGGAGNDSIRGNGNANVLLGLGGNDTLFGGAGNDNLFGGSGNDQLLGEDGNDYLEGNAGADTLNGGNGTDKALADASDLLVSIEST